MQDDLILLKRFVARRDDAVFGQIVSRHLGMVFATALRRVGGDAHLAQDVAQSVFIDLARRAPALLHVRVLAGWLYTSTLYAAAKAVRTEQRRRRREEQAHHMHAINDDPRTDADWARVRPILDDALQTLAPRDRDAILLRFFHGEGFAAIGAALKLSENAARMRVDRALERLRAQLARRGIASTLGALGTTLAAHAAATPPAALASTITTSALAGASGAGGLAAFFNLIAMTKVQLGLAATIATAGIATLAVEHREQSALRASIAQAATTPQETAQVRAELAYLQQTAADYQALERRSPTRELARIRREATDLAERRAQLEPPFVSTPHVSPSSATNGDAPPATPRDGLDAMPKVVTAPRPVYPFELKRAAIPGEVTVSFIVDNQGKVQDAKVLETTHPDLAEPALAAIRRWRFTPGRKGGKAVNARISQVVVFDIPNPNWF